MVHTIKRILITASFLISLENTFYSYDYTILPVEFPSESMVKKQQKQEEYDSVKRKGAIITTGAVSIAALYLSWQALSYCKQLDKQAEDVKLLKAHILQNGQQITLQESVADEPFGFKLLFSKAQSVIGSCAKSLAEGAPGFIAPALLGKLWAVGSGYLSEQMQHNSVMSYIQHHTHIGLILQSLELYTVEYDLYASLLNVDTFNQEAKTHLRMFVQDISRLAEQKEDDEFLGRDYYHYLFSEVQKRYSKKGSELEKLQDLLLPLQSKVCRARQDGFNAGQLFDTDQIHRQDICDLCSLLGQEVQKVATFILARLEHADAANDIVVAGCQQKVIDLLSICNQYFDRMQTLLNSDFTDLEAMSRQNQGMFTCTYEFEKVLKEQCEHIHRYCTIIN